MCLKARENGFISYRKCAVRTYIAYTECVYIAIKLKST